MRFTSMTRIFQLSIAFFFEIWEMSDCIDSTGHVEHYYFLFHLFKQQKGEKTWKIMKWNPVVSFNHRTSRTATDPMNNMTTSGRRSTLSLIWRCLPLKDGPVPFLLLKKKL